MLLSCNVRTLPGSSFSTASVLPKGLGKVSTSVGLFLSVKTFTEICGEAKIKSQDSWDILGGTVDKNLPANAGDRGSIPGPGRSHMPWSN